MQYLPFFWMSPQPLGIDTISTRYLFGISSTRIGSVFPHFIDSRRFPSIVFPPLMYSRFERPKLARDADPQPLHPSFSTPRCGIYALGLEMIRSYESLTSKIKNKQIPSFFLLAEDPRAGIPSFQVALTLAVLCARM